MKSLSCTLFGQVQGLVDLWKYGWVAPGAPERSSEIDAEMINWQNALWNLFVALVSVAIGLAIGLGIMTLILWKLEGK